jgi:hypothetical protein
MRPLGLACFLFCMAAVLSAQGQEVPKDHPPVAPAGGRTAASDLTERLRPSNPDLGSNPVPRRNLIDEFIFDKIEKDRVPHAPLSSDEEFFRRIHIDLTGRIPLDDELRAFLVSSDPDKRDKLVDRLATSKPYEVKWTYSALGLDWTKVIEGTPSGRAFHYIEPFAAKQMIRSQEISPLFV